LKDIIQGNIAENTEHPCLMNQLQVIAVFNLLINELRVMETQNSPKCSTRLYRNLRKKKQLNPSARVECSVSK